MKKKQGKPKKENLIDVSIHYGFATKLAVKEYWRMPIAYQAWIGIDDCVQQVLLHLHKILNGVGGRRVTFRTDNATKMSTYVHAVISRYFSGISNKYHERKRFAATAVLSIDEFHELVSEELEEKSIVFISEAIDHVTRMHMMASPELVDFLDVNLYHRNAKTARFVIPRTKQDIEEYVLPNGTIKIRKLSKSEIYEKRKIEFRRLAKQTDTNIEHYRTALAYEPVRRFTPQPA